MEHATAKADAELPVLPSYSDRSSVEPFDYDLGELLSIDTLQTLPGARGTATTRTFWFTCESFSSRALLAGEGDHKIGQDCCDTL